MSDNEAVIKISNLVKEYKMYSNKKDRLLEAVLPGYKKHTTFRAMNNLNLEIKKGEVLGILGKNGAGKSTLLKMITGVVIPTSGNLEVKGKISSLLELGAAFNPDLTGYENIYQHGQVMGLSDEEIKSKEQEIIDFADIGEHLSQPVKTYSSGMFARLAFACAINVDPDILIVDEVLSVGDMAFQLKCFKKFEQFKNNGKTIIFVTHNINDVMTNCNRVIILENGTKTFDGSVKDGVNRYKKIIVGLNPDEENKVEEETQELETENIKDEANSTFENFWKDQMNQNPNMIEYGNKLAEVIDYGVFDKDGNLVNMFDNGDYITFKSKVKFNKEVKEPIFTVTLKDFSGKDITGTNTNIEKIATGTFKKGEIAVVEFTQKIPVAPGKYTLSFSCTRYNAKGDLEALNRKYDALLIEIIATKNTVGLIRLDSKINIKKL
ncbi:MAG TPA: ABC transporter ATP-binding protein [Candidatus Scatovivens faecipullorum]|nr:ABC transporter ATP-binding protein [Candidatus Scatovivens faecipullorum]